MQKIIIQKLYLVLVEYEDNLYRLFLVIVNFIFNINDKCLAFMFNSAEDFYNFANNIRHKGYNFFKQQTNYFKALFGFNIYSLNTLIIDDKNLFIKETKFYNTYYKISLYNKNLIRYSNLLAPPDFYFKIYH